ncbi:hypothetical protein Taro_008363, partial [Colocasia esculenta]|nr:hypothetical protein [Colocasia esculenta]
TLFPDCLAVSSQRLALVFSLQKSTPMAWALPPFYSGRRGWPWREGLVWRQGGQGGGGEQQQRPRAGVELAAAAAAQQAAGRQRRGSQAAATAATRAATSGEGLAAAAGASPSPLFSPPLLPPAAGKPGRRRRLGKEQGVPAVVTPSRGDAGSNKGGQRWLPQWDSSPKFDRGVPALKVAPGFPVKLKVQREYVSIQSTSAEEIRQHKVYRPSTKDKYKEQARGRTPRLAKAPSDQVELREVGQNSERGRKTPALGQDGLVNEGVGGYL